MIYVDTSAAIKVLAVEAGSTDVRRVFDEGGPFVSSRLLSVELHAAIARRGLIDANVESVLESVELVSLDDEVTDRAIALRCGLRALDALHLATALHLGDAVTSFLAFDDELNAAAEAQGLTLHAL